MKTTKISIKILWILAMLLAGNGLLLTAWRTFDYLNRVHLPKVSLWCSLKAICYVGIILIGFGIYKLWQEFQSKGFFDAKSVSLVKTIGVITMLIAIPNSIVNTMQDFGYPASDSDFDTNSLFSGFLTDFLFESPLYLFLGLMVFIFAGFMQKAIAVKNDNDNII